MATGAMLLCNLIASTVFAAEHFHQEDSYLGSLFSMLLSIWSQDAKAALPKIFLHRVNRTRAQQQQFVTTLPNVATSQQPARPRGSEDEQRRERRSMDTELAVFTASALDRTKPQQLCLSSGLAH